MAAVVSHKDGKKHSQKEQQRQTSPMARFVTSGSKGGSSSSQTSGVSEVNSSSDSTIGPAPDAAQSTMSSFVCQEAVTAAELRWTMFAVERNFSFTSCSQVGDVLRLMFPDSGIATKFALGDRKLSYLCTFGIAPCFSSILATKVKESSDFVLLFDESLNRELQSKQLDLHVRLWDAGRVSTRYCNSDFLGHACADVLHEKLSEASSRFGKRGILQLSMDGPNVNWKAFDHLQAEVEGETGRSLINIGSCGLHNHAQRVPLGDSRDQMVRRLHPERTSLAFQGRPSEEGRLRRRMERHRTAFSKALLPSPVG